MDTEKLQATYDSLMAQPSWMITLLSGFGLVVAAGIAYLLVRRLLVELLFRLISLASAKKDGVKVHQRYRFIGLLANIVPAAMISIGVETILGLPPMFVTVVQNVCAAFVVLTIAFAMSNIIDLIGDYFQHRPGKTQLPIKSYFQVAKIVIACITVILIAAALLDKSPVILLSGLGALAAVLMLVFQDTLLSFVASILILSNRMVHIGDWIEMPQLNADGDVIDISLHTVKVQNWDKTITTIPTRRLISDSFKNWRGMVESGGRRIKRPIFIDQNSVRFLTENEQKNLHRFALLHSYLEDKEKEIGNWNAHLQAEGKDPVNARRTTNIGTFRVYVQQYLRNHGQVHQGMTLLVRQLAPTSSGLPLEIYCFTNSTAWAVYEGIQSDIFDHLLAILPEFGLRVFQDPGGADFRQLAAAQQKDPPPETPRAS